ncbi:MAG TPA: 6-phosphogluconolactonase [Bacteroidota bacterium]|nr:6-phosphogluconolactonase [Bacteroidota bacterium]
MGKAAADHVAGLIAGVLKKKENVNIVFAAAPSQDEFLDHLVRSPHVDWSRVLGFHMDEYIGLHPSSDQFFGVYLNQHLFTRVKMKEVHLIDAQASNPSKECERYASLLRAHPTDIVCMGIGENAHIAFNDPPVADFQDKLLVKIAELDEPCRQQQVNDGCFKTMADVPPIAYTLTVPALLSAAHLSIVVPSQRKAKAVLDTLTAEISTAVPASILRTHPDAALFLDESAASMIPHGSTPQQATKLYSA